MYITGNKPALGLACNANMLGLSSRWECTARMVLSKQIIHPDLNLKNHLYWWHCEKMDLGTAKGLPIQQNKVTIICQAWC